ncbi:MAG: hypothetical protein P8X61_12915 [Limibacillus sp.]
MPEQGPIERLEETPEKAPREKRGLRRVSRLLLGWLLLLIGLPIFLLPVPLSFVIMAVGFLILAQESLWIQERWLRAQTRRPGLFAPVVRLQSWLERRG